MDYHVCQEESYNSGEKFPLEHSSVYEFYRLEEEQINKVKWLESERLGFDCGRFRAEWVWWMHHRRSWLSGMRQSGFYC